MQLLIGIDDTDNRESRGTGFLSRNLAHRIEALELGQVSGITRHQLYVHDAIAYTSQNSSACLAVESLKETELKEFCAEFLEREAAEGSDAGLCIALLDNTGKEILEWGLRAKKEVLQLEEAVMLGKKSNLYLKGFTGTFIGQIGALAAVGLRKTGNDGRFIWLQGAKELRDFDAGVYSANELIWDTGIELVQTLDGTLVPGTDKIACEGWTRPVLKNNCAVLLVEKTNFADYGWKTIAKERIRSLS